MNLKVSYRYANFLERLLTTACSYLSSTDFVTTTVQKHFRKKANPQAQDETLTVPKSFDVDFTPMDVVNLAVKILEEKQELTNAIAKAKAGAGLNIDNAISLNKRKQEFIRVLDQMAHIRSSTATVPGSGYKFNAEGNQTEYYYEIEEATTIDFNRNDVRALVRKYNKECDLVSEQLDALEINIQVDFTPRWDVNDAFEDII